MLLKFFPRLISSIHFTHNESQVGVWFVWVFLMWPKAQLWNKDSVHNLQTNACLLMKAHIHIHTFCGTHAASICIPQNIQGGKQSHLSLVYEWHYVVQFIFLLSWVAWFAFCPRKQFGCCHWEEYLSPLFRQELHPTACRKRPHSRQ